MRGEFKFCLLGFIKADYIKGKARWNLLKLRFFYKLDVVKNLRLLGYREETKCSTLYDNF